MHILTGYILPFLGLISFLIVVHEGGHYLAARLLGIRATEFALGMGPLIFSRKDRRGCAWQLRLLPIGGYVKMAGDADGSSKPGTAAGDNLLTAEERKGMFRLRPVSHRAAVIFAGPAVNLLLGVLIVAGIYLVNGRPLTPPIIGEVVAGMAAETAGIKAGDRITAVNGSSIDRFEDFQSVVATSPGREIVLSVRRGGASDLNIVVVPETQHLETVFGSKQTVGLIGVRASSQIMQSVSVPQALLFSTVDIYEISKAMMRALQDIVTGVRPVSELGGPVKIAEISGKAIELGWLTFIFMTALLSVNLGIMNLLPIPVLDGGHLVLCAAEAATGRPLGEKTTQWLFRIGGAVLVTFMLTVTAIDIVDLLSRNKMLGWFE